MLAVRVLGSVDVERDGVPQPIGSAQQRLVLALLAASPRPISRNRLVDALWEDAPPPSATNTLLGLISRLRAVLGAGGVVGRDGAYALAVDSVDARTFEELVERGDRSSLETALTMWRGDAFGDLAGHPFLIDEARLLESGDATRPTSMLEAVLAEAPTREDAWVLLVEALTKVGRFADAVRAAHRCRRHLAEIGMEPSPALAAAETAALAQRAPVESSAASPNLEPSPMQYVRSRGAHLAWQVIGAGPVDIVLSSFGSISIDSIWDSEPFTSFVRALSRSCRVVLYDTRGIGLSDPIDTNAPPSIDEQSDDLRMIVDASGSSRPVIVGVGEGAPTAITYASRHRDALGGLVIFNGFARLIEGPDYRGVSQDRFDALLHLSTDPADSRDTSLMLRNHAPSVADDTAFQQWWRRAGRRGASPATANALWRVRYGADVRQLLRRVEVPTLVAHRHGTRVIPRVHGAYVAEHIADARFVELPGADHPPFTAGAAEVAELITGFAADCTG
jgi:pimeloyl-ACP methyl ester carboxylesterase/DNA-binding SARP family transcriptional activator